MSRGESLENLVAFSVDGLAAAGLYLARTSPPFVVQSRQASGKVTGYLREKGELDYTGDIWGQAVGFDCKRLENATSVPFSDRYLKEHQVELVRGLWERGGVSGFLVELATVDRSRFFFLTWPMIKPWYVGMAAGGRRSIPVDAILSSALEVPHSGLALDMLGVIDRLSAERHAEVDALYSSQAPARPGEE